MQPSKKFAFDVGITFLASVVSLPLGFVITIALGRYLGAGDLGLYRMASTVYGIALLVAAIGIPAAILVALFRFRMQILPHHL
jgi:O-antigen/teichoic acid export membrane protein